MLIHLDGSAVADAASDSRTSVLSHACVENLLLAHFEGNHIVSLLPPDADTLRLASPPWSARARRALDHIDESYAQIAGLREEAAWSLELGLGPGFDVDLQDTTGGRKILRAPLHRFAKIHTASCAALLAENMTDAELFQHLGLMRRAERGWQGVEMIHDVRGTGGSTFAPEYQKVADQGRIVLAIADSDKRHPKGGLGETYKKLESAAQNRPAYQRARPIHTRMAESLVPLPVYQNAFTSPRDRGDQRLGVLGRLEQLLRSTPLETVLYADIKSGITLRQIDDSNNAAEQSYWRDVAKRARRDLCSRPTSEQCTKREDCRCYVVDALGEKALADVVAWLKTRKSKSDLASHFDLSHNEALSALADEVLSWGLALSPLLT